MRRLALAVGLLVALGAVGSAAFFALDPGDVPEITETTPERTDEGDEVPVEPGVPFRSEPLHCLNIARFTR